MLHSFVRKNNIFSFAESLYHYGIAFCFIVITSDIANCFISLPRPGTSQVAIPTLEEYQNFFTDHLQWKQFKRLPSHLFQHSGMLGFFSWMICSGISSEALPSHIFPHSGPIFISVTMGRDLCGVYKYLSIE